MIDRTSREVQLGQSGARKSTKDKQEIAVVEGELSMLAPQLAAIRKLRKK